jgi:hypothetical protein
VFTAVPLPDARVRGVLLACTLLFPLSFGNLDFSEKWAYNHFTNRVREVRVSPGWIDTEEAAELSGYNQDYVRQLCRRDPRPFEARRKGSMWWIDEASFRRFVEEQRKVAGDDSRYGPQS